MRVLHTKRVSKTWRLLLRFWDFRMPVPRSSLLNITQRTQIQSLLQPGDIFLESDNAYPVSQIITKILDGSDWIHSAIYLGNNIVIDAGRKPCVAKTKLEKFLQTTDVAVFRPKYQSAEDSLTLLAFAQDSIGTPFNLNFDDTDAQTFYCTQLISRAFETMPHPIHLRHKTIFGKTAVPTSSIETCSELECIWSSRPNFFLNLAMHWPIFLGTLFGAYCGSFASIYGLLLGLILGAGISVFAVGKLAGSRHHGVLGSAR